MASHSAALCGFVESDAVEAALQSGQVLRETIGLAPIDGNDFVDPIAVNEAPVEHRDLGVLGCHEFSIEIDGHETFLFMVAGPAAHLSQRRSVSHTRPTKFAGETSSSASSG